MRVIEHYLLDSRETQTITCSKKSPSKMSDLLLTYPAVLIVPHLTLRSLISITYRLVQTGTLWCCLGVTVQF